MKPGAVVSRSGSSVAFSWEQEPGVSKQSRPTEANNPAALGAMAHGKKMTPASTKEAGAAAEATAHPHRLRVPPPPGEPGAPAYWPPGRSRTRSRGVRPGDDPFLAAYLACTEGGSNGGQKLLGWTGLGLGLGHGFGRSCKSACDAVEESMVRLARVPPKFTRND